MTDGPFYYRIFDLTLSSAMKLPELPACASDGNNHVDVQFMLCRESINPDTLRWYHDWELDDGEICLSGAYSGDGYLLRFPELADFQIDGITADSNVISIIAHPEEELPTETLRHLLLDQVIPRVAAQRGALVVHGSANLLASGQAVAFLGETGFGKSTMAVAMHQRGYALLGDDCLAMAAPTDEEVSVTASYVGARLIEDSLEALFESGDAAPGDTAPVAHYSDKARIVLPPSNATDPHALAAIFLLNDPQKNPHVGAVDIARVTGADSVMTLVGNAFQLDVTDQQHLTWQFMAFGSDIVSKVPVFRLSYARDYDGLDAVCERVLAQLKKGSDPFFVGNIGS